MGQVVSIMSNIVHVDFKRGRMTLEEAKVLLGQELYCQALAFWPLEELIATVEHPEAFLTGATDAYAAILRHRESRLAPSHGEGAKVYQFPRRKKEAA